MKIKPAICIFFIFLTIDFLSCKKDADKETLPSPTPNGYTGTSNFFSRNGVSFQNFTVNGTTGGSFIGAAGTKFTVPANAFVDLNSNPVSGDVIVKVKEVYEKKEM